MYIFHKSPPYDNAEGVKLSELFHYGNKCENVSIESPLYMFLVLVLTVAPVCPQHQSGGHHRTDRGGHPEGCVLYPGSSFSHPQMTAQSSSLLNLCRYTGALEAVHSVDRVGHHCKGEHSQPDTLIHRL